jgi:hypothetical protein
MPGTTTTQRALSIRLWGIPLSAALIIAVSASAEASSLSSTLASLSAAKAAVEPAIARTQTQRLKFTLIKVLPFVFRFETRIRVATIDVNSPRTRTQPFRQKHARGRFKPVAERVAPGEQTLAQGRRHSQLIERRFVNRAV